MSGSNGCFLTYIEISQEARQMVWYSHLFMNFPQFVVIHTVKGFGIVTKAEADVFLKLGCFFYDPTNVGNLISGSSPFSKSSLNIWKFSVHILLKPCLENFQHYHVSVWDESNFVVVWDGWMASPTRWTWVWVNSGSWWWTGRPGVLWFMGWQRVGHNWATELNWTEFEYSLA